MTVLSYKGYQASVEYEDGHIIIQLLHIEDFISTSCGEAGSVEGAFRRLVDEYLEACRELGREPKRPYKGSLNIRMPPELHYETAMAAAANAISINAWIVQAIQEKLVATDLTEPSVLHSFGTSSQRVAETFVPDLDIHRLTRERLSVTRVGSAIAAVGPIPIKSLRPPVHG
jgi:predicted HicB family RNase H-like nuclease